jgi:Tfp pilus assembly protein PilZ
MGMDNYTIKNMQLRDVEDRKDSRKKFNDILPLAECKTENSAFKAPIYDLSSSGVFIRTSRQFSIGQEIAMTITFPVPIATLRVTGVIVRTSSEGVAVKFKIFFKEKSFH